MSDEMIVVINESQRAYKTSRGVLPIGGSLELNSAEANTLLGYRGLHDASKRVPQTATTIEELRKRIAQLEGENDNLKAQIAQLTPQPKVEEPKDEEPEQEPEAAVSKPKGGKGKR